MRKPLVILGAGAAGLSAALHAGNDAVLFEQAADAGGLCRSLEVRGYRFDETAHVLYFHNESVRRLVYDLLGDNFQEYQRQATVYTHGRYLRYPFQAHLHGLPQPVIEDCLRGKQQADARQGLDAPAASFDSWVQQHLGSGVARHFMDPYNTKFWTLPLSDLACDWAQRFVPVPSFEQMVQGSEADDPIEYGYNIRFAYPRIGGVAALMRSLVARAPSIALGKRVVRIDLERSTVWFADGTDVEYERLVSTIPLPELARLVWPLPDSVVRAFESLRWLSLYVLHLGIRDDMGPSFDWAYFPQPEIPFFRVGCPSRYAPDSAPPGCRTLSVEMSFSAWKPLGHEQQLQRQVIAELRHVGLLKDVEPEVVCPVRINYGYPIYDHAYHEATRAILAFLRAHHIIPSGRFGRWAYLSLEDSLLDGMQAAAQAGHPAWQETLA